MLLDIALLMGTIGCAIMAIRTKPLIASLWLAICSAFVAILLYVHGAFEIAVVELSVGAGLITVLLAFAISMAEDEKMPAPLVPRTAAWLLIFLACGLLGWLIIPEATIASHQPITDLPFVTQVWNNRLLDLLVQIAIVLTGVIGVLSLLGETKPKEIIKQTISGETK